MGEKGKLPYIVYLVSVKENELLVEGSCSP